MPNHKSSEKRARQSIKRNERNRTIRTALRTAIKKFRAVVQTGSLQEAQSAYPSIQKVLDRAVTKGVLNWKTANRYKSRLAAAVNKKSVSSSPTTAQQT